MTQKQLKKTQWKKGIQVTYDGGEYWVTKVNHTECLLCIVPYFCDPTQDRSLEKTVRCENVKLIKE